MKTLEMMQVIQEGEIFKVAAGVHYATKDTSGTVYYCNKEGCINHGAGYNGAIVPFGHVQKWTWEKVENSVTFDEAMFAFLMGKPIKKITLGGTFYGKRNENIEFGLGKADESTTKWFVITDEEYKKRGPLSER